MIRWNGPWFWEGASEVGGDILSRLRWLRQTLWSKLESWGFFQILGWKSEDGEWKLWGFGNGICRKLLGLNEIKYKRVVFFFLTLIAVWFWCRAAIATPSNESPTKGFDMNFNYTTTLETNFVINLILKFKFD